MQSEIQRDDQNTRSFIEVARRAQIVQCAAETIAELGFARTSLAQIAKRARVSNGVILYYFSGKEALIAEVTSQIFAAGEAFIGPRVDQSSATAALLSFITASVAFMGENPRLVLAVMEISRAGRAKSGAPWFDRRVAQARQDAVVAILQAGHDSGEFRPFAIEVMAATLVEALDAIPPALAAAPDLDFTAYGRELCAIFDRATRQDDTP